MSVILTFFLFGTKYVLIQAYFESKKINELIINF